MPRKPFSAFWPTVDALTFSTAPNLRPPQGRMRCQDRPNRTQQQIAPPQARPASLVAQEGNPSGMISTLLPFSPFSLPLPLPLLSSVSLPYLLAAHTPFTYPPNMSHHAPSPSPTTLLPHPAAPFVLTFTPSLSAPVPTLLDACFLFP